MFSSPIVCTMSYLQNVLQRTSIFVVNRSSIQRGVQVQYDQVRHRSTFYPRKYVQPHYRKKLLLACAEPVMPVDRRPDAERCYNLTPKPPKPDHPYDILLARDMKQELESSQLCCFLHQNPMGSQERRLVKNAFQHEGMMLRYYNRDIARIAMANTKYAPLLHFAVGYHYVVLFAPDLTKISKIKQVLKPYSELIPLGALIDNRRLVTVAELDVLAKTSTDIGIHLAMLSQTLVTAQQRLVGTLQQQSSQLSRLLEQHSQDKDAQ